MKRIGLTCINFVICIFLLFALSNIGLTEVNVWESFVLNPNEANYEKCKEQIADSSSMIYEEYRSPIYVNLLTNYNLYLKFLAVVDNGNEFALKLGFQMYGKTDGALKELMNVSLGKNIVNNPKLFLILLNIYAASLKENDYYGILLSYGDDFVDKQEIAFNKTKQRINSLNSVKIEELKSLKEKCINILNEFIAE